MKNVLIGWPALALAISAFCTSASASTILEVTAGTPHLPLSGVNQGQSLDTPAGPGWNNIEFNFYQFTSPFSTDMAPFASGNLFILTQAFTGQYWQLSTALPGFYAESTGIVADGAGHAYVFDPGVTLNPNTE